MKYEHTVGMTMFLHVSSCPGQSDMRLPGQRDSMLDVTNVLRVV